MIRAAVPADLGPLNDLYNHYVRETHATFDIEPTTLPQRRQWFSHYGTTGRHRVLVAVSDDGLLGFATSSPVFPRAAYDYWIANDPQGASVLMARPVERLTQVAV